MRDARIGSAALVLMHKGKTGPVHRFGAQKGELYQVASVSKAVTAFGVMTLVQDGKLKLDEPVRHYRERVTMRQLLSHTAGLDDGRRNGDFAPVTHEPGAAFSYSTGGYANCARSFADAQSATDNPVLTGLLVIAKV